jgi:hypothetical protein
MRMQCHSLPAENAENATKQNHIGQEVVKSEHPRQARVFVLSVGEGIAVQTLKRVTGVHLAGPAWNGGVFER